MKRPAIASGLFLTSTIPAAANNCWFDGYAWRCKFGCWIDYSYYDSQGRLWVHSLCIYDHPLFPMFAIAFLILVIATIVVNALSSDPFQKEIDAANKDIAETEKLAKKIEDDFRNADEHLRKFLERERARFKGDRHG